MKRILLHICCGPCAIYPYQRLKEDGLEVDGFFYNPNIYPLAEYNRRKITLQQYGQEIGLNVFCAAYEPVRYFSAVGETLETPRRCFLCWQLRLSQTAEEARKKGYDYFSTTLLVSPYQDQAQIKDIGMRIETEMKVKFWYEDYRVGFRNAHNLARQKGMYCQNYCGCIYSYLERRRKKQTY